MATRPKFAWLAHYSCKCIEASHIFFKNGLWRMSASLASPSKLGWRMSASLASPSKPGWWMSASLASPAHFRKRPFWRVLEFDKFAVEWPLLKRITLWNCRIVAWIFFQIINVCIQISFVEYSLLFFSTYKHNPNLMPVRTTYWNFIFIFLNSRFFWHVHLPIM